MMSDIARTAHESPLASSLGLGGQDWASLPDAPFCPTRIVCGRDYRDAAAAIVGREPYVLVTSGGWIARGAAAAFREACGNPVGSITNVTSHPSVDEIAHLRLESRARFVVALGGGSVIDAAKAMQALVACGADPPRMRRVLTGEEAVSFRDHPLQLVAIPTTAGTGSEVTPWATLWGADGRKHSVSHPGLSPAWAILDPALCATMPADVALCSALDAASHAMEAVWNRRHSSMVDLAATSALAVLRQELDGASGVPAVSSLARRQTAATYAGLAIRSTRTALAHSISYPLTSHFKLSHGFACSFTLGEVARFNLAVAPDRLVPIAEVFGCAVDTLPDAINSWLRRSGIGRHIGRAVRPSELPALADRFLTPDRADNNVRRATADDALQIVRRSLAAICPELAP